LPNLLNSENPPKAINSTAVFRDKSDGAEFFPQAIFIQLLCLERKRIERSGRRLVLMLLESPALRKQSEHIGVADGIWNALSRSTRDTDIKGWHKDGTVIGVIFTEVRMDGSAIVTILSEKVKKALRDVLTAQQIGELLLSFQIFPDDCESSEGQGPGQGAFSAMYPDLLRDVESKRTPLLIKRSLDIVGSMTAILVLAPLLILIAIAVRLTSRGPVLFRQTRLGQYGKSFTFLKFRSMYAEADHAIHEAYMKRFISNEEGSTDSDDKKNVYKLNADPRITRLGRFLRRSSLDELPQFFNVLAGRMSLVGPRPPLHYEFAKYETWHRRRLLVKPGITGFWQIEGRSRVKFDDMVRMDLEYASAWSLWLDIKILWRTPRAVVSGAGAC
jgi:lipopolysaccharide/colanic/teichoic acid biosynthesis glycosyltransferase